VIEVGDDDERRALATISPASTSFWVTMPETGETTSASFSDFSRTAICASEEATRATAASTSRGGACFEACQQFPWRRSRGFRRSTSSLRHIDTRLGIVPLLDRSRVGVEQRLIAIEVGPCRLELCVGGAGLGHRRFDLSPCLGDVFGARSSFEQSELCGSRLPLGASAVDLSRTSCVSRLAMSAPASTRSPSATRISSTRPPTSHWPELRSLRRGPTREPDWQEERPRTRRPHGRGQDEQVGSSHGVFRSMLGLRSACVSRIDRADAARRGRLKFPGSEHALADEEDEDGA